MTARQITARRITIDSPLGPLTITAEGGVVTVLDWGRVDGTVSGDPLLDEAAAQVGAYVTGRLQRFELPLQPAGTAFQRRVWDLMLAIPYGQTWTYGTMARHLGSAARAVGGACGRNPIPIIIPCHRVVGGGNSLGGYSGQGGLVTKTYLLDLERRHALQPAT